MEKYLFQKIYYLLVKTVFKSMSFDSRPTYSSSPNFGCRNRAQEHRAPSSFSTELYSRKRERKDVGLHSSNQSASVRQKLFLKDSRPKILDTDYPCFSLLIE